MMRIALVSQEYPPETAHGGIATQTHAKACGLAALGHEVYVVSHSVDGHRHERRVDGVEVIRIPGFDAQMSIHTAPARWITYSALVAAEVAQLDRRVGLDVVDFPEFGGEAWVHLLNRPPSHRLPTVIHLHGPLVMLARTIGWPEAGSEELRVGAEMERTCLRLADAIVSSSRCSADWAAAEHGIDTRDVPVIHTGVDTARFRPGIATPDERPTILFVGRVARSKGVDTLAEAACALAREIPGLRLRLVGRAEAGLVEQLQARVHAAGFADLLEPVGFVPRAGLPEQLCRAHVFAAPSRYEGGPGFVYLEAMACGLPVVACSGSGAAEVVTPGETGLLVPPDDAHALAASLRGLLADRGRLQRMGRAARAYALAEADSTACIRRFEGFLRSVAGRTA
jgi:glycosyltransferase involved in cell wall biosynthesis